MWFQALEFAVACTTYIYVYIYILVAGYSFFAAVERAVRTRIPGVLFYDILFARRSETAAQCRICSVALSLQFPSTQLLR